MPGLVPRVSLRDVKAKKNVDGRDEPRRRESTMTTKNTPTLAALANDLEHGRTSARKLVDDCLAKIADTSGEGARAFIHVDAEAAIEAGKRGSRLGEVRGCRG